jgi:hypothetical protein
MMTQKTTMARKTRCPSLQSMHSPFFQKRGGDSQPAGASSCVQCKLTVGSVADPLEREADRVADLVMQMPGPRTINSLSSAAGSTLTGRRAGVCQKENPLERKDAKRRKDDETVHGKLTKAPAPIGAELEHRVRSLNGGDPLSPSEQRFFEPRFGYDFSRVKVHTGTEAAWAARDLGARAFTLGRNIVFARGQYAPGSETGRHLLAHELAHVVQQGTGGPTAIQRDLATPEPAVPPAKQPDLTQDQIQKALAFNKMRFDAVSTKEIQDLVGTTPTGTWTEDDVVAIAAIQESFGLKKDGMVGPGTFRFLDKEITLEKLDRKDKNCLVSFAVIGSPVNVSAVVAGQRTISATFRMSALLPKHCRCADYEYRQFIRGHWRRIRGGVVTDLAGTFSQFPGGAGLPAAWQEDGNTTAAALNYGHRAQPDEDINHYLDNTGAVDQANGCRYEGEDTPGGPDSVVAGDVFDIRLDFRGEIQRRGRVVTTKHWTPINGRFPV